MFQLIASGLSALGAGLFISNGIRKVIEDNPDNIGYTYIKEPDWECPDTFPVWWTK